MPDYSVPALEDAAFAPTSVTGGNDQPSTSPAAQPRLRFNPVWFQFLQKIRQGMLAFPAAILGVSKNASATLNAANGIVITEALTTAAGARYTLTVLNNTVVPGSNVMITVLNGSNTQGAALLVGASPGSGNVVIEVLNAGSQPFNGSLQFNFLVF